MSSNNAGLRPKNTTTIWKPRNHDSGNSQPLARAISGVAIAGIEIQTLGPSWLTMGVILFLLFLPVSGKGLYGGPGSHVIRRLSLLIILCCVAGFVVTIHATQFQDGHDFVFQRAVYEVMTLLQIIVTTALVFWAARFWSLSSILLLWASGAVIDAMINNPLISVNPWKYGLAIPCSVALLSFFRGRASLQVAAFISLLLISQFFAYRSFLLILVVAALAYLTIRGKRRAMRSIRVAIAAIGAATLGGLLYLAAFTGQLGSPIQDRTLRQLEWGGGNLLLGGRTEWGAALALFQAQPMGLGIGVTPAVSDWSIAFSGLRMPETLKQYSVVGLSFDSGTIEFHSVFWNFWSQFGIVGMILAIWIILQCLVGIVNVSLEPNDNVPERFPRVPGLNVVVLLVAVVWAILFSPFEFGLLGLALGVVGCLSVQTKALNQPQIRRELL